MNPFYISCILYYTIHNTSYFLDIFIQSMYGSQTAPPVVHLTEGEALPILITRFMGVKASEDDSS